MICSLQKGWPQAHGKRIKTKSTWWFITETTLSMEGTNTHGLQIHVKQYQGCSRAETRKSRCCPKLEKLNTHNTYQEIKALSCEQRRAHCELISNYHQWTKWQRDSRGRIQTRNVRSLGLVELALVFSLLWRQEPATKTRPGLRSRATEKHRNSFAAFPLKRRYYPQQGAENFSWCSFMGN